MYGRESAAVLLGGRQPERTRSFTRIEQCGESRGAITLSASVCRRRKGVGRDYFEGAAALIGAASELRTWCSIQT